MRNSLCRCNSVAVVGTTTEPNYDPVPLIVPRKGISRDFAIKSALRHIFRPELNHLADDVI